MNIEVKKLKKILNTLAKFTSKEGVLSNCYLVSQDKKLSITVSDIENTVKVFIDYTGPAPDVSNVLTPFKPLKDFIGSLSCQEIVLNSDFSNVTAGDAGSVSLNLKGQDLSHFPILTELKPGIGSINAEKFFSAYDQVKKSMSLDNNDYIYSGLYLSQSGIVATDGRRLAVHPIDLSNMPVKEGIVIDRKALSTHQALHKIFKKEEFTLQNINNHEVRIITSDYVISSRLLQGKFPDYERVMPVDKDYTSMFNIAVKPFVNVLKTLKAQAEKPRYQGKIDIAVDSLCIDGTEILFNSCDIIDNMKIGINLSYLLDTISSIKEETCTILFYSETQPVKITAGKLNAVIMPMRI